MNTMQLSCFVEVAAQLSFSKAAEALHMSQPTVSHQIKALEDELGCALLVRSTRTDCSTSPATICHHSVSHQSARRAWRTLSVD